MPQKKILVDSNGYLRLAREIHPFLATEFGKDKYCLYIIDDFEDEYYASNRLQSTFYWVKEKKYIENRSKKITRSRKEIKEIQETVEYIRFMAQEENLTTSLVDIKALAVAHVLKIHIVTDDSDMLILAKEFGIKTYKSIELLQLLSNNNVIDMKKINSIIKFWECNKDIPKNLYRDYKELFDKKPP